MVGRMSVLLGLLKSPFRYCGTTAAEALRCESFLWHGRHAFEFKGYLNKSHALAGRRALVFLYIRHSRTEMYVSALLRRPRIKILFALAYFAFGVVAHRWSTKETQKFYLDTLKYRIKHGESEKWNKLVESRACEREYLARSAAKQVLSWEENESHVFVRNLTAIQRFISADQRNLPWLMWDTLLKPILYALKRKPKISRQIDRFAWQLKPNAVVYARQQKSSQMTILLVPICDVRLYF